MNDGQQWLALPPAELAAVILPYFSSKPRQEETAARRSIVVWLTGRRAQSGIVDAFNPDERPVAEAIQVLEHASLLMRDISGGGSNIGLTRLGSHALQTNTVRQHLGLSDAPPTA
jgi:hypothetical protein